MNSATSTNIKKRKTAKDVFITPLGLAKKHIDMIDCTSEDIWYDPFKNDGSYYNQYPTGCKKDYSEILEGKDFFEFKTPVDIICSNPPYSIIDKVMEHSVSLQPRVISYLIGMGNFTNKRTEYMRTNGYGLVKIYFTKVMSWYGMSMIVVFEKDKPDMEGFGYDRVVWKET